MADFKEKQIDETLEPISLDNLQVGDTITISPYKDATRYVVLDKGVPFILIENVKSRFASLYRPDVIYKPKSI